MPQVRYTGSKPKWFDNTKAPGVVWTGNGDVQTVSDAAWSKLAVHADVLELADKPAAKPAAPTGDGKLKPADLAGLDDAAVHAIAKERKYGLHHTWAGDKLRDMFAKAEAADERVEKPAQ